MEPSVCTASGLHNGQSHDYVPDFIVRLKADPRTHLIVETKGFDDLAEVKTAAAQRWVAAVNADGRTGTWHYSIARRVDEVRRALDAFRTSSRPIETAP